MRGCTPRGDRGEVDIIGPSEGLVASSILAGRTSRASRTSRKTTCGVRHFISVCARIAGHAGRLWIAGQDPFCFFLGSRHSLSHGHAVLMAKLKAKMAELQIHVAPR